MAGGLRARLSLIGASERLHSQRQQMARPENHHDGTDAESVEEAPGGPPGDPGAGEGNRHRLVAATLELIGRRGLVGLTVDEVVATAGVSREIFERNFDDIPQLVEEAFETSFQGFLAILVEACDAQEQWPLKVKAGIGAALDYAGAAPLEARLLFAEPGAIGPALSRRALAARDRLASMLAAGRHLGEEGCHLPPLIEQALTAGLVGTIAARLEQGEAGGLPQLAPDLVTYTLLPYLGRSEAARIAGRPFPVRDERV